MIEAHLLAFWELEASLLVILNCILFGTSPLPCTSELLGVAVGGVGNLMRDQIALQSLFIF